MIAVSPFQRPHSKSFGNFLVCPAEIVAMSKTDARAHASASIAHMVQCALCLAAHYRKRPECATANQYANTIKIIKTNNKTHPRGSETEIIFLSVRCASRSAVIFRFRRFRQMANAHKHMQPCTLCINSSNMTQLPLLFLFSSTSERASVRRGGALYIVFAWK